jgi:hypothetical protein
VGLYLSPWSLGAGAHPSIEGLTKLIQSLSELITKANAFTEGRRSNTYILKTNFECLSALLWVVYTQNDNGELVSKIHF